MKKLIAKITRSSIKGLIKFYLRRINPELLAYSFEVDEQTDIAICVERAWTDENGKRWHSFGRRKEEV